MRKYALIACLMICVAMGLGAKPRVDLAKQQWNGMAICYSGYRVGQHPDKFLFPSKAEVLEDLRILEKNWKLIRTYGCDQHAKDVLETIRQHRIQLKVMLGMWISGKPGKDAENERQVDYGIQLAREYPGIVVAVNVGNEALVSWSDHKLSEDYVLERVKKVKAAVKCPVTVADDYLYWVQPDAKLVPVVDFITLHTYPIWNKKDIEDGLPDTVKNFHLVQKAHPGKTIVFGEVGWASYTVGEQHVPRAGDEVKQKRFFEEINTWAKANQVTTFTFSAFDEPWKGDGTEGHWGLFTVDRKAKPVMQALYPKLKPTGPTSPSYVAPASEKTPTEGK